MNNTMGSTRPIGDITTVLDLVSRNAQDDFFFPLDTTNSWFHREGMTTYPATMTSQEFTHKGTAAWGGRLTFELDGLQAGDLLQSIIVQIKLSSWYDQTVVNQMNNCKMVVYKPNNYQYAQQGAVSSSSRILKLNVSTIQGNLAGYKRNQQNSNGFGLNPSGQPSTPFLYKNKAQGCNAQINIHHQNHHSCTNTRSNPTNQEIVFEHYAQPLVDLS